MLNPCQILPWLMALSCLPGLRSLGRPAALAAKTMAQVPSGVVNAMDLRDTVKVTNLDETYALRRAGPVCRVTARAMSRRVTEFGLAQTAAPIASTTSGSRLDIRYLQALGSMFLTQAARHQRCLRPLARMSSNNDSVDDDDGAEAESHLMMVLAAQKGSRRRARSSPTTPSSTPTAPRGADALLTGDLLSRGVESYHHLALSRRPQIHQKIVSCAP